MKRLTAALMFCALVGPRPADGAENWPAWRGASGTGQSTQTGAPVRWSATENVVWKTPLATPGNSTPIVWNDKLYLTAAEEKGAIRSLLCFDRKTGTIAWRRDVEHRTEMPEATHDTNPYCASSPVTDGRRVVVWHGSAGLHVYDMEGRPLWSQDLGAFEHIWGYGSSPVILDDLVVVSCGPGLRAFVAAWKLDTGEEVWRFEPPESKSEKVDEFRGSWSTPVPFARGDRRLLLLALPLKLYAVDAGTGKPVWWSEGPSKLVYTSPLTTPDTVVTMCGYHGPALALRAGGEGDVTESHRLWIHEDRQQNPQRVGSGVIVDDHVYILNENGVCWCLELKTGERKWEQRLGKVGSWSSMCHVDGRIYALNMNGNTFVLEPDPEKCAILAENQLDEMTRGSLAFSDGQVFVRTYENLYCIGERVESSRPDGDASRPAERTD